MKNYCKSGVSLIAVLLFMLAATTASIVVFRWIWQENFSSGARLKASEAYQASQAGLEATQSWLANKGADAGALIKVFEDASLNPGKGPVLLNSNGIDLLAGSRFKDNNNRQQEFKVYLTGVNTEKQPYRLKFLSEGTARDGSKHRQTAIFEVSGLYEMSVNIPVKGDPRDVPALFIGGGNVLYSGTNEVSSAYINGDWTGNPPKTQKDFVVTGNLRLSGNNVSVGGATCVGKILDINNQCENLQDVYVGGNCVNAGGGFKNLFVEGTLTHGSTCHITVSKNLTVTNGPLEPNLSGGSYYFYVDGNLVMGNSAVLDFTRGANAPFRVTDSVWIPYASGIRTGQTNNPANRILGNRTSSLLAVQNLAQTACTNNCNQTGSTTTFSTNAINKLTNLNNNTNKPLGADSAKIYCDGIWSTETTCSGERFVVEDIIKTADLSMLKNNAVNKGTSTCAGISNNEHRFGDNQAGGNQAISALNACAKNNALLYNGFLIVNVEWNQNANFSTPLDGNFIFIFSKNAQGAQFRLPPTTANSRVLMYLENGVGGMIMPSVCDNPTTYNYFIYVLKGFPQVNGFRDYCPINGTVYAPRIDPLTGQENCNRNTTQLQGETVIHQNTDLLEELFQSGIICNYEGGVCQQGNSLFGGTPENQQPDITIKDVSYVPAVPHLKVTLQSQYASEEGLGSADPVPAQPAILVMPRIIYAQQGEINNTTELAERYNVLYLNGAQKSNNLPPPVCQSGSCTPSNPGVYTYYLEVTGGGCTSSTTLCRNPFYVVVADGTSSGSGSSSSSVGSGDGGTSAVTASSSSVAAPASSSAGVSVDCGCLTRGVSPLDNYGYVPPNTTTACIKDGGRNYRCRTSCNEPWVWFNQPLNDAYYFEEFTCDGTPSSSSAVTATCAVAKSSVTQGENIGPPTITCSGGAALNKANATFNGTLPNDYNNWKTTGNAYYTGSTNPGTYAITVSNIVCGSTTLDNIPCNSITVNRPTCTGLGGVPNGGSVTVGQTITPTVSCGNNVQLGNRTFSASSWANNNTTGGSFSSASQSTTPRQIYLSTVQCDGHTITVPASTVNCGGVTVSAAPSSSSSRPSSSSVAPSSSSSRPSSSSSRPASSSSRPSSSSVAPSSSSAGGSVCGYNPAWCNGIVFNQVVTTNQNGDQNGPRCVFATTIELMGNENGQGGGLLVNGIKLTGSNNSDVGGRCGNTGWGQRTCADALAAGNVQKADGGYYIYIPSWAGDFRTTGGTPPAACGGGGTPSSSSAGGGGGTTIAITGSDTPIPVGTHAITCTGGGQLGCWTADGQQRTFTLDGANCSAFGGKGWGSCGQGTCKAGTIVTTFPMTCAGMW